MALTQSIIISSSNSSSSPYTIGVSITNASFAKYLKVGDYIEDSVSNKYVITTWSIYPSDFLDGGSITVTSVGNSVKPTVGSGSWYTPNLTDVNPPVQTNGNILTVNLYSGQNFEYTVQADWESTYESNKAIVGDYIIDSSGTLYQISYLDSSSKFSTSFRVKEVHTYGNPINSGVANLFRPTPTKKLFTGKYLTQDSINNIRNRDNYILDDSSGGGSGTSGIRGFSFLGPLMPIDNMDGQRVITGSTTITKIIVSAFISGDSGSTAIKINIGNGPSGTLTQTVSLSANSGLSNVSTTTLSSPISLSSGDMIWADIVTLANGRLEDLTVDFV